ncbi:MAG: stage II sporulation protein M [Thermoplasmata archaeon]
MKKNGFFFKEGVLKFRSIYWIIFIAELLLYIIISSLPINDPVLYNSFKSEQNGIISLSYIPMVFSIFPHNLTIASVEFVPVLGPFLYIDSSVVTSLIIAVEGTALGYSGFFVLVTLMIFPHFWLEIPSYAVATATSIYLIYLIYKRGEILRNGIRKVLYLYIFVILELFIAGSVEAAEIIFETTYRYPYDLYYPLMMWIPGSVAIFVLILLFRRINRDEYGRYRKVDGENDNRSQTMEEPPVWNGP